MEGDMEIIKPLEQKVPEVVVAAANAVMIQQSK